MNSLLLVFETQNLQKFTYFHVFLWRIGVKIGVVNRIKHQQLLLGIVNIETVKKWKRDLIRNGLERDISCSFFCVKIKA